MNRAFATSRTILPGSLLTVLATAAAIIWGQQRTEGQMTNEIRIIELQGAVEISPSGAASWILTQTNQTVRPFDRMRTGPNSRVALRWSDNTVVPFGPLTELEILPEEASGGECGLHFIKGILSFFHRDKPGRIRVITRGSVAGIEGTEFVLSVDDSNGLERTTISVVDGRVHLSQSGNAQNSLDLTNTQQAIVEEGKAPVRTAGFIANNLLQWCFYYPAVLDPDDLPLTAEDRTNLADSITAYRTGNLVGALAKYPASPHPGSDADRLYQAALLLSVGNVGEAEKNFAALNGDDKDRLPRLAHALRRMIATVKRQPDPAGIEPQLPTELLAASYAEQSKAVPGVSLETALKLARQAATRSPEFGFAWERVAELEFGFGHTRAALDALNRSLALSPKNAQALALKGFLLAAQNRIPDAIGWFDQALAADSSLGNAWLGRGLCRIRQGEVEAGREDLLIAAALEPQRSLLRSYLGKSFANSGDDTRAIHELALARRLDPGDPTPWLYSALLDYQENRTGSSVTELEKAVELNDNRAVYRSGLLLDKDRAVASSSLAKIYQNAGMDEISVEEATRAVNDDYANYSAHLFLADSYNALRDPTRVNLRYETAWFNELLLANLLSPSGARPISENISQQEYSRLLEQDGFGFDSSSQYRSDGQFQELASQYGARGRTSYSLDLDYQHNSGVRPNNSLSDIEWYSQIKQQISPNDAVSLFAKYENYHSGDNFQYNNPVNASPSYRENDYQTPLLAAAYHHEWAPGSHTLLLAGRLPSDQHISDQGGSYLLFPTLNGTNFYSPAISPTLYSNLDYSSSPTLYTAELNQLLEGDRETAILGTRYQFGQFPAQDSIVGGPIPISTSISEPFQRLSIYGYLDWELLRDLLLTTGLTYDRMRYPDNFRFVPITPGTTERDQISPKVALTWTPSPAVTVRAAYARALGGVSFDESFTLEPTQIGGFNQAFRSIIPESLVGSLAGVRYEILGGAVDLKLKSRTYATVQAELLRSHVADDIGVVFAPASSPGTYIPGFVPEQLHYSEPSASITVNQLLGDNWSLGAQYRYTRSELSWSYPNVTSIANEPSLNQTERADLNQVGTYLQFTHPCGLYALAQAQWYLQHNSGQNPLNFDSPQPRNEFAQINLLAGYRFRHRRGDLTVGVLNVGGGNYNLNPLNAYNDLPRSRVFFGRISLNF